MATFSMLSWSRVERFNGNHETASITKVLSNILPPSIPRPANYMHGCMTCMMCMNHSSCWVSCTPWAIIILRWVAGMYLPSTTPHSHEKR